MILDDLASYLQTAGLGTVGTDIFKGAIPLDAPHVAVQDQLLALLETPGLPSVHSHQEALATYQQPVLQCLVRGAAYGYEAARTKAEAAFLALDGVHNQVIGNSYFLWIMALQSPWWLRSDEMNRPHLVFQVRCAVRTV